jgi:SAM-dependent methyltransferase
MQVRPPVRARNPSRGAIQVLGTSERLLARTEIRRHLCEWFAAAPGRSLLGAELARLGKILPNLFGYHLMQIGDLGADDILKSSRVLNRVVLRVDGEGDAPGYATLCGTAEALPVAGDCLDVVVLPHLLEFERSPHRTLREVERVLVPEGHVVITGFNPWSLMGLSRVLRGHARQQIAPWSGHFLTLPRVKDWLALLGFDIVASQTFHFRPPAGSEPALERLAFLESWGRRLWPYLGAAYVVVGRKRVITLTPIRPDWRSQRNLLPTGWAEPTTKVRHEE